MNIFMKPKHNRQSKRLSHQDSNGCFTATHRQPKVSRYRELVSPKIPSNADYKRIFYLFDLDKK